MVEEAPPVVEGKNGRNKLLGVGLAGAAFGVLVGILVGMQIPGRSIFSPAPVGQLNGVKDTLLVNESATAVGVITEVSGNRITIKNASGETKQLMLVPNFYVYKFSAKNAPASVFQDVSAIELNKEVVVNLSSSNGEYLVNTITYLEPEGSASGSASPR